MRSALPTLPGSLQTNRYFCQWLAFEKISDVNDTEQVVDPTQCWVVLKPGKVEIGQGIGTALIQIAAQELALHPSYIRLQPTTTGASPDEGVTSGSLSIQDCGRAVRHVCGEVRASGLNYWSRELDAWLNSEALPAAAINETSFTYVGQSLIGPSLVGQSLVGQSLPRIDLPAKFAGRPVFIQDLRLPDMQFALVVRGPAKKEQRAALRSAVEHQTIEDQTAILIEDGNFCAAISPRLAVVQRLQKMLEEVHLTYCADQPSSPQGSVACIRQSLLTLPSEKTQVCRKGADDFKQVQASPSGFTGEYFKPWIAHASIGLCCAVAMYKPRQELRVWTHSQGVYNLRKDLFLALGERLGFGLEQFIVIHVQGAGCYGHNGADDVAFDAARVAAEQPNIPIRLQWSREQELGSAPFSPAMLVKIDASLDNSTPPRITQWQHTLWSNGHSLRPGRASTPTLIGASEVQGGSPPRVSMNVPLSSGGGADRNSIPGYSIPNLLVESHHLTAMPVRSSAFRALGAIANVFAIESMMDDMAASLGEDPYAFRHRHLLDDARALQVLAAAAKMSGWQPNDLSLGLAYARYKNTGAWCCVVAQVELTEKVVVHHLWIAADVGLVINPDGVLNQLEGGAIQATSIALLENAQFATDPSVPCDWAHYPIIKFSEVPRVTIELCASTAASLGAGEAATAPVIAAIGNAIARSLGARIRTLPFTPETIAAAV
jgi:CO/xanthine dehydrogenase Mo-binding subunit